MLSAADRHLPGYAAGDLVVEVLGPVVESAGGETGLRWLGDLGKTKNGHSVVLRLRYRDVRVLLGGDLNIPSEHLLLSHHTGLEAPARSAQEHAAPVEAARRVFAVDVAKACHHGSADLSLDFLSATNPIATVVSSGDEEPYAHPRADALGAIGATSRGPRPLIFSTELARSAREAVKHPRFLRARLRELPRLIASAPDEAASKKLDKELDALTSQIDRSIAVFGAINLRTDGRRAVLAYKIEAPRDAAHKWDVYPLVPKGGQLRYESKHEG